MKLSYLGLTPLLITLTTISMDEYPLGHSGNWATATFKSLSLDEKIGQLFMVATVSDPHFTCPGKNNDTFLKHCPYKTDHVYIKKLIKKYRIGGIIFLGYGTPETQKTITDQFQQLSKKIPLLVGQDCEWGLSMRLDKTTRFPHNMALGAIQENSKNKDDSLMYQLGQEIGRQCMLLGVHINFAPVVDSNTNPDNPIINDRSFGENTKLVAQKSLEYMRGLHASGVLACAKHFPGHGDTATDSHLDLPVVKHNKQRLDDVELYPFKQLINAGVALVMTAHLAVPALEKDINRPATLSKNIITDLLKDELGFNGLVVTDGLGMSGVTKNFAPGNLELEALLAGNDMLVCPLDVPKAIKLIKQAIKQKQITEQKLNERVFKILLAKEWVLKQRKKIVDHDAPLSQQLNTIYARALKKGLYQKAITLVRDTQHIIPLEKNAPIHVLLIGAKDSTPFAKELQENNKKINTYYTYDQCSTNETNNLLKKLKSAKQIIIGLHGMTRFAKKNYGITPEIIYLINTLCAKKSVALVVFGNPYSLKSFNKVPTLICAYEDDKDAQTGAAQVLLGSIKADGKLPVSIE